MKKKDLIMSIIKSYSYNKIKPFVETLKKTSFRGDLVLFVCEVDKKTREKLLEQGAKLIDFKNTNKEYINHFPSNFKVDAFNQKIPLASQKFLLYEWYLSRNYLDYNCVLLTDIDVVFQKNPFDFTIGNFLYAFAEDKKIISSGTDIWIKNSYGEKILRRLSEKACLCCGTIIGKSRIILKYLRLMKKHINDGSDQGIYNYLIYERKIRPVKIFENGKICLTASEDSVFKIKKGKVYNLKGEEIYFIHQWHKNDILWKLFGKPNFIQKSIKKIKKNEKIRIKLQKVKEALYSIPFLGKHIRKFYVNLR